MFIDSHAHFDICIEKEIAREEIQKIVDRKDFIAVQVSTEFENIDWSRKFSNKHKSILYTAGIHPSSDFNTDNFAAFENLIANAIKNKEKLFGIGETGLDYHWMHHTKNVQQELFDFQRDLSIRYKLPLIVHNREAHDDVLASLRSIDCSKVIIHCFSGDKTIAKKFLDLGCIISFAGNVTFKKAVDLQQALAYVPLDRLLLETDSPFLTPVPFRGKTNRPDYVEHVYNFVTELKQVELENLKKIIEDNFFKLCPALLRGSDGK